MRQAVRKRGVGRRPAGARASVYLRALFLFAVALPCLVCADVFWRFKKSYSRVLQDLGGKCVYTTAVQVNGAPGTLNAYNFENKSSSEMSAQLKKRFAITNDVLPGMSAMITTQEEGRVQRFVVIPSGEGVSACLVMVFEQASQEMKKRSQDEPLAWPEGLSTLPGTPRFTAVCEATRTAFVTSETAAEPADTMKSVETAMTGSGWKVSPVATDSFKLFVRGTKTCIAFAARPQGSSQTILSVMQRDGAEKQQ